MHWGAPLYLNLFLLIPLIAIFFIFISVRQRKRMEIFADKTAVERILAYKSEKKERLGRLLIIVAIFFLIVSLSMPQIGTRLTMKRRSGRDIIIAIDTSLSMLAQDIKPNRLEKAKFEIMSFIDRLKGDRVGILTFAGDSFVQCPLTLDYNAAKMFLDVIEVDMMPVPGTAIGNAIRMASKAFVKKQTKYKVLLLLTDGENHGNDIMEAVKEAKDQGVIIYTIGIGSRKGEPIPIIGKEGNVEGYKKDKDGKVVMSRLGDVILQRIAITTGGKYYNATSKEFELDEIYNEIDKMKKKELSNRFYAVYEERFQYFLAVALILLCIEFILGDRKNK